MFNQSQFNTFQFNTGTNYSTQVYNGVLQYNNFLFGFPNFMIAEDGLPDINNLPVIQYNTTDIAGYDGEVKNTYLKKRKIITVIGYILGDNRDEIQANIDSLKRSMNIDAKELRYTNPSGEILTTQADVTDLRIDTIPCNLPYVRCLVEFTTLDPYFYSNSLKSESFNDLVAPLTASIYNDKGHVKARPVITVAITTASASSYLSVGVGDRTVTVEKTYSDGDIVQIDCKDKYVYYNGVGGAEYSGVMPFLPIEETQMDFDMDGTFEVDVTFTWRYTYE